MCYYFTKKIFFKKLVVTKAIKKFQTFYWTPRFIAVHVYKNPHLDSVLRQMNEYSPQLHMFLSILILSNLGIRLTSSLPKKVMYSVLTPSRVLHAPPIPFPIFTASPLTLRFWKQARLPSQGQALCAFWSRMSTTTALSSKDKHTAPQYGRTCPLELLCFSLSLRTKTPTWTRR